MYRLSSIILLLGVAYQAWGQSTHGDTFKMDCAACHTPKSWEIPASFWQKANPSPNNVSKATGKKLPFKSLRFNHDDTEFVLDGQHATTDCRSCHETLEFAEAQTECISCHTDMHQQTVGDDCTRCHNTENWLVDNTSELHYDNGFPLLGAHATASCYDCHDSESALAFNRIGNECMNCHLDEYTGTTSPNHASAGYSTNCIECHDINAFSWSSESINHNFFPLTKGHDIEDCASCHNTANFSDISADCISCHQTDFTEASNPNHIAGDFNTDCRECHTTDPGWTPAQYLQHDVEYFPIYSGEHQGEWDQCVDCHTNPSNFAEFSCTTCHTNPETDEEHQGIDGYSYNSQSCLACHPTGDSDGAFDHNLTNFPLTGAHLTVDCIDCHAAGYAGTPTDCAACHTTDFNQTVNPNHNSLGLSNDCASCHTTEPEWNPAAFASHNDHYALNGAHATIANDCVACHNGDYNNTPNTCVGCHQQDYDQTTNPNHVALNFSTNCIECHSENSWEPATFDHDAEHFPIYSGVHSGEWDQCLDCHTNPGNYAEFTCVTCHANPETDNQHNGITGYSYNSPSCLACHPTGTADGTFDHNLTNFPLTGAHLTVDCIDCHAAGYAGTPTDCAACHTTDFNQTVNPNHNSLGLSNDCASCHTTEPAWNPATFANHNDYYALNGAHAAIANDCATCHNGDYNNTPNTCVGCHQDDYNQTTNPDHNAAQFPTDCESCHTEIAWVPAAFNHDGQYFPIYSGKHKEAWNDCVECHTIPSNYSIFSCIDCHQHNNQTEVDNDHSEEAGYVYASPNCLECHPTGN